MPTSAPPITPSPICSPRHAIAGHAATYVHSAERALPRDTAHLAPRGSYANNLSSDTHTLVDITIPRRGNGCASGAGFWQKQRQTYSNNSIM